MKWSSLSYRTKTFYLLAGFALCLAILCTRTLQKTYTVFQDNREIERSLTNAENAPERITRLTHEIAQWESLTVSSATREELQLQLFDNISTAVEVFDINL